MQTGIEQTHFYLLKKQSRCTEKSSSKVLLYVLQMFYFMLLFRYLFSDSEEKDHVSC